MYACSKATFPLPVDAFLKLVSKVLPIELTVNLPMYVCKYILTVETRLKIILGFFLF